SHGGGTTPATTGPGASADGGAGASGAGAGAAGATGGALPAFTSNVPMQPMPPPFQLGSRKADKRPLAAGAGATAGAASPPCTAGWRAASGDLSAEIGK